MESKCKNCMCFNPATYHSDGSKGTCGQSGELLVHNREDLCMCGKFMELPKMEKVKRTIEKVLKPWVRERDEKFVRSLELVCHIGHLFEQGEFKVFDVVKSASDMKGLIFHNAAVITPIYRAWTYHCPWNDEYEHFIVLTTDGKMVVNAFVDEKFVTQWFDVEDIDLCFLVIDRIRDNCVMKVRVTDYVTETEHNKCVSDSFEKTEIFNRINSDDELPPLPPVININDGSVALPHEKRPICDFDGPCALPFQMIRYPR